MHGKHAAHGHGEKHGDSRGVESDGVAIDRAEAEHRAFRQADHQHAEHPERREHEQTADAKPRLLTDFGV
ncbi:MAG: hypothetical protein VCB77_10455, partial [Alphaproteobacteria bacterium]